VEQFAAFKRALRTLLVRHRFDLARVRGAIQGTASTGLSMDPGKFRLAELPDGSLAIGRCFDWNGAGSSDIDVAIAGEGVKSLAFLARDPQYPGWVGGRGPPPAVADPGTPPATRAFLRDLVAFRNAWVRTLGREVNIGFAFTATAWQAEGGIPVLDR
jgi:hypothetical protein